MTAADQAYGAPGAARPVQAAPTASVAGALVFLAAHIPLAYAMRLWPMAALAHMLATVGVGVAAAGTRGGDLRAACVAAYIVGSEVLWRMTKAGGFWETGKYAVVLVLLAAIVRRPFRRRAGLPLVYLALLLPSALPLLSTGEPDGLRNALSFNLSGPLSLAVCAWYFGRLRPGYDDLRQVFLGLVAPLVGVAFLCHLGLASAAKVTFGGASSAQASGGFGPNQVSAMLGLGALAALLWALLDERGGRVRPVAVLLALWFAAQSALTFSRGGLYGAAGALAVAAVFLVRDSRARVRLVVAAAPLCLVGASMVAPALDEYTGGRLGQRWSQTSSTGRDRMAAADLALWQEHLLLGVGPGQAMEQRTSHAGTAEHTEQTRLLAEHGVFGLTALLLLLAMAVRAVRGAPAGTGKALAAGLVAWSLLYMLHAGMRLAAPGFAFGLAMAGVPARPGRAHARPPERKGAPGCPPAS